MGVVRSERRDCVCRADWAIECATDASDYVRRRAVAVTKLSLFVVGPILEVMQYEADPWTGLSKLTAPVLVRKIQVISLVPVQGPLQKLHCKEQILHMILAQRAEKR